MPATASPALHPGARQPSATVLPHALLWAIALVAVLTLMTVTGLAVAVVSPQG